MLILSHILINFLNKYFHCGKFGRQSKQLYQLENLSIYSNFLKIMFCKISSIFLRKIWFFGEKGWNFWRKILKFLNRGFFYNKLIHFKIVLFVTIRAAIPGPPAQARDGLLEALPFYPFPTPFRQLLNMPFVLWKWLWMTILHLNRQ